MKEGPTIHPDLPAEAPGPERRVFPVVLHKSHVVRPRVNSQRFQAAQVQLLGPAWVWLQYDLWRCNDALRLRNPAASNLRHRQMVW